MKWLSTMTMAALVLFGCNVKKPNSEASDNDAVKKIINPPEGYTPIAVLDGEIKDLTMYLEETKTERYSGNLIFKTQPADSIADKEIKYWIFKTWTDHKQAKAITIKCFTSEGKLSFRNGDFAPNGNWSDASLQVESFLFKLKIY
jgi:hypothetical protein